MVTLRRITKTEDDISADYYPEGERPKGFMKISLHDGIVMEHNGDPCSMAPPHVKRELGRLAKLDHPPAEKTILWY